MMKGVLYTAGLALVSVLSYQFGVQRAEARIEDSQESKAASGFPDKRQAVANLNEAIWLENLLAAKDYDNLRQMADAKIVSNLTAYASTWPDDAERFQEEMSNSEKQLLIVLKRVQDRSFSGKDIVDYEILLQRLRDDQLPVRPIISSAPSE
ncbi:hypothetical protein Rhal01_03829 [Rubritalea halochordaticola]|uniref:Uncharacterized protein n=1 Tax=Rubritalea halochordaticola TaxID=714537 RepID=A0ABP9V4N1_9BACT